MREAVSLSAAQEEVEATEERRRAAARTALTWRRLERADRAIQGYRAGGHW
jgi:hypothetical protein